MLIERTFMLRHARYERRVTMPRYDERLRYAMRRAIVVVHEDIVAMLSALLALICDVLICRRLELRHYAAL